MFSLTAILWCRAIIAEAMDGELEFQFIHAWFNVVFPSLSLPHNSLPVQSAEKGQGCELAGVCGKKRLMWICICEKHHSVGL